VGNRAIGKVKALKQAARMRLTPGGVVRTCPSVRASSRARSFSTASMSALSCRQRLMLWASRSTRTAASTGAGRQSFHRCASRVVSRPSVRARSDRAAARAASEVDQAVQ